MFTRRHILSLTIVLVLLLPASSATAPSGAAAEPPPPPQASATDPRPFDPAEPDWYAAVQEGIRQSEHQIIPLAGTGWQEQTGLTDLPTASPRAQGRCLPGAHRASACPFRRRRASDFTPRSMGVLDAVGDGALRLHASRGRRVTGRCLGGRRWRRDDALGERFLAERRQSDDNLVDRSQHGLGC